MSAVPRVPPSPVAGWTLQFVAEGVPNRIIAERLGKSLRTVEGRRGAIFAKTQVDTVAQLVRLVMIAEPKE